MTGYSAFKARYSTEWNRSISHPFVRQLWEGTLADGVLGHYLVQDYMFCDLFVGLLGRAVSLAPRLSDRLGFARVLGEFASDENTYFERAFRELNISDEARSATEPASVTQQFLTLMDEVVNGDSYLNVLALLAVAECLYGDWACLYGDDKRPPRSIHSDWIRIHNNPSYNPWTLWLRERFDEVALQATDTQVESADVVFRTAVTLEYKFFDQAYRLAGLDVPAPIAN